MAQLSPQALGQTVRGLRARRRLTQRQFGDVVGLKAQHVSEIELGRVNPSLRTLSAMASALGLRTSELLAEAERHGRPGPEG